MTTRRRWLARSLGAALVCAALACWAPAAGAYLYWAGTYTGVLLPGQNPPGIGTASLAGGNVQWMSGSPEKTQGIVSDGSHVFFSHPVQPTIGRIDPTGAGLVNPLIQIPAPTCNPFGGSNRHAGTLTTDGSYVYWTDPDNGTIGRAGLDGSGATDQFLAVYAPCGPSGYPAASGPGGVAVGAGHIYWTNPGAYTIGRANLDGSGINNSFISLTSAELQPAAIAISGSDLYWSDTPILGVGNTIGHAQLDGNGALVPSSVNSSFITGVSTDATLTVSGGYLYFDNGDDWIGRSTLDGSSVVRHFVNAGPGGQLAADAQQAAPTSTSVSCRAPSLDALQRPVDGSAVNLQSATPCTFTVRDGSSSPQTVGGSVSVTQSPQEGFWLFPKGGSDDTPSAGCQLTPTPSPGVSACTIGYDVNPDTQGFKLGVTHASFAVSYSGETAHTPSAAGTFTMPLRILHTCYQGLSDTLFVLCDTHGNVVNGASNQLADQGAQRDRTFTVSSGRLTLKAPQGCLSGGQRAPFTLVYASTTIALPTVKRVVFTLGRSRSASAKHNPYVVRLMVPHGRHGARLTLTVGVSVLLPSGRRAANTVRMTVKEC